MTGSRNGTLQAIAACVLLSSLPMSANAQVIISIDASKDRHAINPNIYGVAFASKADLIALNAPLNRMGGNATTSYNWKLNARNLGNDWYFESYPGENSTPGADADSFISATKSGGAQPMITIPLIGWVAKLGANRAILPSFSVSKYGAQCAVDPYDGDAGDGIKPDCATLITGNNPNDSYVKDGVAKEQKWVDHLIKKWGRAPDGGVRYYVMDNEPSIWFSTHRDSHPVGPHATEYRDKVIAESTSIKSIDPDAQVVATEEWGWEAYFYSGFDQQYAAEHGYRKWPDHKKEQHGMDYIPWLLSEWKQAGHPVDVLSVHFYPQGGEDSGDTSQAMQLLRNRSTRQLWDKNYTSESWIDAPVYLIPRMKDWIQKDYYPGTPVAITEYNWGAENHINGATTQADIYGIFGREGLDMATRWTVPDSKTPTYKAMQMYRNYDGADGAFGETSISAQAPNPDDLSAFAAMRASDNSMTVMVISKVLSGETPVQLNLSHATAAGIAKVWRLTASNQIQQLADLPWSGGLLNDTEPAQSITLYVLPQ
ncbi:MAG: glycoside hydrolase family 44 protein [Alphaproteobacteria bacterium]|nr:glycoside hydrolase family 44 protein [Alphaproteobacteria bacterium]MBV9063643.1 glycoside hydrolase family 44 protein [Alphaproteobacteria bacterium]